MPTRILLRVSTLSLLGAGIALSASAENGAPFAEQPTAAQDRAVIEGAYSRADGNQDGRLSKQEAAKLPAIGAKFDQLDEDKDGSLNLVEFAVEYAAAAK